MHHRIASALIRNNAGTDEHLVLGHRGAATDHRHAHWVPLADPVDVVTGLLIWVPSRLTAAESATVLAEVAQPVTADTVPGGIDSGLPEIRLLPQAAGPVGMVAAELCGPATVWQTTRPYLPVRHRKSRHSIAAFLTDDITRACAHRGLPAPVEVTRLHPGDGLLDDWAAGFRRYRLREVPGQQRVGLGLRLTFPRPVTGPLFLGRLSHFGFGMFLPAG